MRVASLFAGAGGLDLGFVWAGYDLVWAIDNYEDAVETYRANINQHAILADISTVSTADVPHADVIVGGFPCQGFSVANMTRSGEDGRNRLYLHFVRFVSDLRPPYFVAENVKGLLSLDGGAVFKRILQDFRDAGYKVVYAVLRAADYGVPQNRERVFLLGIRDDLKKDVAPFPPAVSHADPTIAGDLGVLSWHTVGEALEPFPEPEADHSIPNHSDYSRYKLRFNGYLGHRVVNPDRPAPTLTARGDMRGGVVVIHHPDNERRITPREAATIQGFPLEFVFKGSRTSCYRQIANAVPPPLAQAVAESLRRIDEQVSTSEVPHGVNLTKDYTMQHSLL